MSVKFQQETVRTTSGIRPAAKELAHEVGERLTGGKTQTGYLAVCIHERQGRPSQEEPFAHVRRSST